MTSIAIVTSSRADYCHLRWLLEALRNRDGIESVLIATGALLDPAFGNAVEVIQQDGFTIDYRVECLVDDDSDAGMARTLARATDGFAELLTRIRPDMLLVIADRYEMLAPAAVALTLRIPIAHIEGGDVSEGAIDQAVRDALTKISHIHFTPTEAARRRVMAMGEEPWRVHCSGAPSLDHLIRSPLLDRSTLAQQLGFALDQRVLIVSHHPVTLHDETTTEADAVLQALEHVDAQIIMLHPNADAGGRAIGARMRAFCSRRPDAYMVVNLDPVTYWSLLSHANAMVGNSSSGVMESPSLRLPAVNVGDRQRGRDTAANTLSVSAESAAIQAAVEQALSTAFRESLGEVTNPYGDGHASERIADVLASVQLGERLLAKRVV